MDAWQGTRKEEIIARLLLTYVPCTWYMYKYKVRVLGRKASSPSKFGGLRTAPSTLLLFNTSP